MYVWSKYEQRAFLFCSHLKFGKWPFYTSFLGRFIFIFFVKSFNFCIIGVLIMDCTSIRIILTSWQLNMKSPHRNSTFKKLFNLPPNEFLIGDFVMLSMRKLALQVYSDGWIWSWTAHLHKLVPYYSFQFIFEE